MRSKFCEVNFGHRYTVLHCYTHWEIDIEKVINSFVVKKKRHLGFLFATRDDIDDQN
jgi:hypothetical protein